MLAEPLVLIVEDNPANLLLVETLLRGSRYRTVSSVSAEEALERIDAERPDVILMDIQLPGIDGLQLTRQLKADPSTQGIVVIALSAHAMGGEIDAALQAGCDGYIRKPIETRTFIAELDQTLARFLGTRSEVEAK